LQKNLILFGLTRAAQPDFVKVNQKKAGKLPVRPVDLLFSTGLNQKQG